MEMLVLGADMFSPKDLLSFVSKTWRGSARNPPFGFESNEVYA